MTPLNGIVRWLTGPIGPRKNGFGYCFGANGGLTVVPPRKHAGSCQPLVERILGSRATVATIGDHYDAHASAEFAEEVIEFVIDQHSVIEHPGLVQAIILVLVDIGNLSAMPGISKE